MHYYAGGYKNGPSYASAEEIRESYKTCVSSVKIAQNKVRRMRELLGDETIKISFDEWNVWYGWYRPSCLTDGIFTVMMMNMIIGEAQTRGIGFACQFEAVNESAIRVTPTSALLTATGQALALMKVHAEGTLLYADDCSVATEKEGTVSITVVNPSYDMEKTVLFECNKDIILSKLYEGKSLCPHNRFEISDLLVRKNVDYNEIEIPPHSIAFIQY